MAHAFARWSCGWPRATRVPQNRVSKGQQGSLLTTAHRRLRPRPGHHLRVPKLTTKYLGASGGPLLRDGPGVEHGGGRSRGYPLPPTCPASGRPTATSIATSTATDGGNRRSDMDRRMRPHFGRPAGNGQASPMTPDQDAFVAPIRLKRHVRGVAGAIVVSSLVSFAGVHLRSLVFKIDAAMQVTNVSVIRRLLSRLKIGRLMVRLWHLRDSPERIFAVAA
jgi:hypothetical protein